MTSVVHSPHVLALLTPDTSALTPDELATGSIDPLVERVASQVDAHARSVAIADLTVEIFETVGLMQGSDPDPQELASLYRVLAETHAHRSRMATRRLKGDDR